jgi:VanZ family protein
LRFTFFGVRLAVLLLATYWVALSVATHLPPTVIGEVQKTVRWNDKLFHSLAFAILAFLLAWAVPTNSARRSRNVLLATAIAASYAGIDELTQIPVGRTADWADLAADLFGILIGIVVYVAMREALFAAPPSSKPK